MKQISQTKLYVGQIKRKSFVLYQMTRSVILYTGLLMIRQKYNVDNFQTNPTVNDVYLVFGKKISTTMSQDIHLLFPQSVVQTVIENQQQLIKLISKSV